jgi:hypothetical protein
MSKMNELEDRAKTKYKTSLEQAYSDNTMVRKYLMGKNFD